MVEDNLDHSEPRFRNRDGVISIKLGVSRRDLMKQIGAVAGVGTLAGCSSLTQSGAGSEDDGSDGGQSDGGGSSDSEIPSLPFVDYSEPPTDGSVDFSSPNDPERRMDFVVHDASIEFFLVTVVGMNDALNNLGWTGEFIGPTENNETSQLEFLQDKVTELEGGRDALATSVLSSESYMGPIGDAIDEGIPVVNINTRVDWSREFMLDEFGTHVPYVGQPDFPAGNAVGQAAFGIAEQKMPDQDLVFQPCVEVPGHPALQTRIDGVINYLESQAEVEVRDELDVSTDVGEARSRIGAAMDANPGINILIGTFSPALAAAARIGEERGITDEIVIGGFDTTPLTYEEVQAGNADFTTTQDPYSQGFMPPHLVYKYLDRGVPMKDYQTDIAILTREDVGLETTSSIDYGARHIQALRELYDWQQNNYDNATSY